jgi:hypothetical protein
MCQLPGAPPNLLLVGWESFNLGSILPIFPLNRELVIPTHSPKRESLGSARRVDDLLVGAAMVLLDGASQGVKGRLHTLYRDRTPLSIVLVRIRSVVGHIAHAIITEACDVQLLITSQCDLCTCRYRHGAVSVKLEDRVVVSSRAALSVQAGKAL